MRTWAPTAVLLAVPLLAVGLLAGCAPADDTGSDGDPAATPATAGGCSADTLPTLTPGTLTFATDDPAYPPWYVDNDPANGQGYEAGVAYAVAAELGYDETAVSWVRVPFNAAIAPGPKPFDASLSQFSITPERAQAVDFSAPYYDVTQAVVTVAGSPAAGVGDLAGLAPLRLGAQVGTTSYAAAEDLGTQVSVYNTNDDARAALSNGQIDALVVDLPTAFQIAAETDGGSIVGQVPAGAEPEQFGMVLDLDSPLTDCVAEAVQTLDADGVLAELAEQWLAGADGAPQLG